MKLLYTLLLTSLLASLQAQDFYDLHSIQTIEVTFAASNWDQQLDNAYAADAGYILADQVIINGVTFDSVGVKYKGNSSYRATQVKNPWHIELDTYKDHVYDGYTDIKLANGTNDPSMIREVLSYQIVRQYMDAPLANFANLYVNGDLIGLYANTESISKKFMNSRFGSKENARFKCSPPDGAGPQSSDFPNLVYLGQDSTDYYDSYELKSDVGWQELIDLCDTLANHTGDIEKILDVNRALWMLAFDNVTVNLDSYIGRFSQNYYLYRSDFGQFLPVIWDLNESFGVFSQTGSINLNNTTSKQQMTPVLHESDANFPLVQKLLSVPSYRRMYLAHMKTILLENFDNGAYLESGQLLQATIDDAVQADDNKFFTYADFTNNLTNDLAGGGGPGGGPGGGGGRSTPGITSLMDGRSAYLLGLTEFSAPEPSIADISPSNPAPQIDEVVTITALVGDANAVFFGYREAGTTAPFSKVEMLDDGAHGDGAANDGVYGAELLVDQFHTEYYLYAENDNIGMFSPRRAEHEFYTLSAASNSAADSVVINEFMASNDLSVTDPAGEYEDWIELYNNGTESVDLGGYYLSDDPDDPTQWSFPEGTTIDPDGYLIVWADEDDDQEGLHASFKLSASGESILFLSPDGSIVDSVDFPEQTTDVSYARIPNGTGDFQVARTTFNASNDSSVDCSNAGGDIDNDGVCADVDCDDSDPSIGAAQAAGTSCDDGDATTQNDVILDDGCSCAGTLIELSDVVINEFMASNDSTVTDQDGEYEDWIELYNNGAETVDLSGYFLTDDDSDLTQWSFPEGTSIEPDGYLIVWADEDIEQEGLHADFKLSASGETILLLNPTDTSIVDGIDYPEQTTDISYGRIPNGIGEFQVTDPTFGAVNGMTTSTANASHTTDQLTIYPNPAESFFYLEFDGVEVKERVVVVYDMASKQVYHNTVWGKTKVDISDWSPGMYVVRSEGSVLKLLVH